MTIKYLLSVLFLFSFSFTLYSAEKQPIDLIQVGITPQIGQSVPSWLLFTNAEGIRKPLSYYLSNNKPTILNFVYFNCPMLCNLVLNGLIDSLNALSPALVDRFNVLTVSIDPRDTASNALAFKSNYVSQLSMSHQSLNWSFLVGDNDMIDGITKAVGYSFKYLPKIDEFSHASGVVLLDKDGTVKRYLNGIEFNPFNLKMALFESNDKSTLSPFEQVLLFCYNYDPSRNSYVIQAVALMKIGGFIFIVFLFIILYRLSISRKDLT